MIEVRLNGTRRDERKDAPLCQVTAAMKVGRISYTDQKFVCDLAASYPVNVSTQATTVTVKGFIADHQLRVIEAIRKGGTLAVGLDFLVTCVYGEPGRLLMGRVSDSFQLQPGEWATELERADAGSYVELLVPLPVNQGQAVAVRRIRQARDLMRNDQVEQALGEARKAIESVRSARGSRAAAARAAEKDPKQRTKEERWAMFVESSFSLLSGAVHDDSGTTDTFEWSRAEADTLIISTAGLLAQIAETEHVR